MSDNNYQYGKIYSLRYYPNPEYIYIGSTKQPLYKRLYGHKYDSLTKDSLIYKTMRATNDINNWYIELYETFPCNNKEELNKRENEVIRELKPSLNTYMQPPLSSLILELVTLGIATPIMNTNIAQNILKEKAVPKTDAERKQTQVARDIEKLGIEEYRKLKSNQMREYRAKQKSEKDELKKIIVAIADKQAV